MPELEPPREALRRLIEDGFVRDEAPRLHTTPRWNAAMARAALALQRAGAPWRDLRLPIAAALAEHYGELPDEDLAPLVEAMLKVEEVELAPVAQVLEAAQRAGEP